MATDVVKQIRRRTRRKFSADEKIRIVRSPIHLLLGIGIVGGERG